ncbi:hypothetical protein VPHD51_0133 [Vibrio phage D51]
MISRATNQCIIDDLKMMTDSLEPNLRGFNGNALLNRYKQTLRVKDPRDSWSDFMHRAEGRDGFNMEQRFNGWASSSPFPAVPFVQVDSADHIRTDQILVVLTPVVNNSVWVASIGDNHTVRVAPAHFRSLIPIFANKLGGSPRIGRDLAERCARIRKAYKNAGNDFTLAGTEKRDDLVSGEAKITGTTHAADALGNFGLAINSTTQAFQLNTTTSKILTEENTNMKNIKADNFINDQKEIAKEIASLNAGRVSNKVVKEAMRPLVALLFKPTWTQKLAMKLTGAKNPLDEFMNTPYADFLCAQLFKAVIDMREVDNVHVKKTANSAVIYAGLKVTEELPVEDLIDKAIKQVTDATSAALGNKDGSDS